MSFVLPVSFRCGHTLTAVTATGEPGSANYIGPRLILFGGATALEGGGGPAPTGAAGIRKNPWRPLQEDGFVSALASAATVVASASQLLICHRESAKNRNESLNSVGARAHAGLAGATADVHCFDVTTKTWNK